MTPDTATIPAPRPVALVVDDEPAIRELIGLTLARMEIDSLPAADIAEAKRLLHGRRPHLCLTDMKLPDGSGLDLVAWLQEQAPEVPVAVITAHGNVESAVQALKNGAFDFVSKPVDVNDLRKLVNAALRLSRGIRKETRPTSPRLMGTSHAIEQVRAMIARVARSQAPIHISGESGTGKELAARLIHATSARAGGAFVPVNCGAIPGELMESEFFGHKKGSFTGAMADKEGLFQAADGGTLFLDEVADLPFQMQVKLLRVVQEKAIRPVGAAREVPVDVRILSATHKNLSRLVAEGGFREDLYYRINVIELHLPALRERAEDIALLADYILDRVAELQGITRPQLAPEALAWLNSYDFPGNIRELENLLERALTLCQDDLIRVRDLEPRERRPAAVPMDMAPATSHAALREQKDAIERQAIEQALEKTRYNKTAAAKLLGMTFRQLRYRIKKLGIG